MSAEIKVPAVGESISSGIISLWHRQDGDYVRAGDALFTLDTDKVSTEVAAQAAGLVRIKVSADQEVKIGEVVGLLEDAPEPAAAPTASTPVTARAVSVATPVAPAAPAPVTPVALEPQERGVTRKKLSWRSARSFITAAMSHSLKVVRMAALRWAATSWVEIFLRSGESFFRVTPRS